jgi:hypothetical protein
MSDLSKLWKKRNELVNNVDKPVLFGNLNRFVNDLRYRKIRKLDRQINHFDKKRYNGGK